MRLVGRGEWQPAHALPPPRPLPPRAGRERLPASRALQPAERASHRPSTPPAPACAAAPGGRRQQRRAAGAVLPRVRPPAAARARAAGGDHGGWGWPGRAGKLCCGALLAAALRARARPAAAVRARHLRPPTRRHPSTPPRLAGGQRLPRARAHQVCVPPARDRRRRRLPDRQVVRRRAQVGRGRRSGAGGGRCAGVGGAGWRGAAWHQASTAPLACSSTVRLGPPHSGSPISAIPDSPHLTSPRPLAPPLTQTHPSPAQVRDRLPVAGAGRGALGGAGRRRLL